MFNDVDKVEENENKKLGEEKNNNENINDNIMRNYNLKQNEDIKNICKKIDFNNEDKNDNKIFILESGTMLSDIMNIHRNSIKFNYNIQMINTDFNDFINLCSFNNDENRNIENISYDNYEYNNSFSVFSPINQTTSNLKKNVSKIIL